MDGGELKIIFDHNIFGRLFYLIKDGSFESRDIIEFLADYAGLCIAGIVIVIVLRLFGRRKN